MMNEYKIMINVRDAWNIGSLAGDFHRVVTLDAALGSQRLIE